MKSVFTAKQIVYQLLISQNVTSLITGEVYKDKKPSGSKLEDIVINAITADNQILQDCVINVNCHIPYLEIDTSGVVQYVKNEARMSEIFEIVNPLLEDKYTSEYDCRIERHEDFDEEKEKQSYINFRLNLIMYNN